MFELHVTPKQEFLEDFKDIAQRLKLKLISHWNYDIEGNPLYCETMIAEKCNNLSDLNNKIELLMRTAKQHNLLRVKIESMINDDFSYRVPYKMGANYYEVHVDVGVSEITKTITHICYGNKCAIFKNPDKDTYMLTFRTNNLEKYKTRYNNIIKDLNQFEIPYTRILKEYCFCDDNVKVDDPWLSKYNYN